MKQQKSEKAKTEKAEMIIRWVARWAAFSGIREVAQQWLDDYEELNIPEQDVHLVFDKLKK